MKNTWNTGGIYEAAGNTATLEAAGVTVTFHFNFIYKPIKNSESKVYCILYTATDVTERMNPLQLLGKRKSGNRRSVKEWRRPMKNNQAVNGGPNEVNEWRTGIPQDKNNEGILVIIMSAHVNSGHMRNLCRPDGLISKPYDIENILERIQVVIN